MLLCDKCTAFAEEIIKENNISEATELNIVRKNVLQFISDAFNGKISPVNPSMDYIAADSAVVEAVDIETGLCFRRELPVRYEETGNGVSLIGEDIAGNSAQISFLSEAAYEKIKDLTGKGPDAPVCGEHE